MRFKGTLILLIAVVVFGGYIYFYEIKGGEKREKAKQTENQLWKVDGKNIVRVDLIYPDSRITAERKGAQWALTAPQAWDADNAEIERLANSGGTLTRGDIIEPNAADLTRFGLNPARCGLRLKTRDGKEYGVDFGITNPTGASTYAVLAGKREVFLIAENAANSFAKKVDDLRDHTVLKFDRPQVQSVNLRNSKGSVELIKDSSDRWWFAGSDKRAADGPEVRGLLNALSLGKIKEFFNENIQDYSNARFDKPLIDVSITIGPSKAVQRLIIGEEKSKLRKKASAETRPANTFSAPLYLAKDESRPGLFFVEQEMVDKLLKSANDLREKALVSFQRWDIDSIFLTNSKGSFRFVKSGGEWYLAGTPRKAKWDSINGILDALEKPVLEWIDKPASPSGYGFDKPSIRIVLKQGSSVIGECVFGKSAKNGIYAQVSGDSSVKIANPEGLEMLSRSEPDYVDSSAAIPSKK